MRPGLREAEGKVASAQDRLTGGAGDHRRRMRPSARCTGGRKEEKGSPAGWSSGDGRRFWTGDAQRRCCTGGLRGQRAPANDTAGQGEAPTVASPGEVKVKKLGDGCGIDWFWKRRARLLHGKFAQAVWGRHTVVAWLPGVWAQLSRRLRARNRPCAVVRSCATRRWAGRWRGAGMRQAHRASTRGRAVALGGWARWPLAAARSGSRRVRARWAAAGLGGRGAGWAAEARAGSRGGDGTAGWAGPLCARTGESWDGPRRAGPRGSAGAMGRARGGRGEREGAAGPAELGQGESWVEFCFFLFFSFSFSFLFISVGHYAQTNNEMKDQANHSSNKKTNTF
jgi:hypothetical protein